MTIDERHEALAQTVELLAHSITRLEAMMEEGSRRMDRVEAAMEEGSRRLDRVEATVNRTAATVDKLAQTVDKAVQLILNHDERITRLEDRS